MSAYEKDPVSSDEAFSELIASGFQVRPASFEDLPAAVEMFNAAEREMHGNARYTLERYEQEWRLAGFNLDTDTMIVLTDEGAVVGLVEVWDILNPPVHPWMWARVDPAFQNQGIGTAMMNWAFSRARVAKARLKPDFRLAPRAGTIANHQPSTSLLEDLGMEPIRYGWAMLIEMQSPPPKPAWPENIHVRNYQHPQEARAVYQAQDEAFQDHWGYIPLDFDEGFGLWQHRFHKIHAFDPGLWFLAMDGDDIAGMSICYPHADEDPEMGWVEVLCVRKPWRKKGLGLALLHHCFGAYFERGMRRVGLDVDSQNLSGATRLYHKAGMHKHREQVTYEIEMRPGKEITNTG